MKHARSLWLCSTLLLALPLLILIAVGYSETGSEGLVAAMRFLLSLIGVGEPFGQQEILKLRLVRALCAAGVGGSLALAGAMTQGLFRNPLAEPGLLGIGSGASLGAVIAIAMLGGYGPDVWTRATTATEIGALSGYFSLGLIPVLAFCGALVSAFTIYRLATRRGRISVPTLLLTGLAINSLLGALMAGLQVLLLQDWQVSRAIISWGFGTLDDRGTFHLAVVGTGSMLALATIPFVALELDLMAGGEEDAAALGADPVKIKTFVLASVALATAAAISVSGQIAFVGLLVPHVTRAIVGPHHRVLLPISFLAGAALLVSVVVFQHVVCPLAADSFQRAGHTNLGLVFSRCTALQPGVVTSLMGAPFFLYLLLRQQSRAMAS